MAKEKNSKKEKTNNRSFGKDFKAELKKVVWPTSKQMVNNVVAVLTIVIITALIVFVLDFAFGAMNNYGITKLKEKVQKNNTTTQTTIDDSSSEEAKKDEENSEANSNAENTNTPAEVTENTESAN